MIIVKFFASFRERAGKEEVTLNIEDKTSLGEVIERLKEKVPGLNKFMEEGNAIIAVNHEVANRDAIVKKGDEIAIFPPVSGG